MPEMRGRMSWREEEAAIVARVRELFKFADKDHSGFIDEVELRDCFRRFGLDISEDELQELIAEADQDEDMGIDLFEFEDMIIHLLEMKCNVKVRPPGANHRKVRGDGPTKLEQKLEEEKEKEKESIPRDLGSMVRRGSQVCTPSFGS